MTTYPAHITVIYITISPVLVRKNTDFKHVIHDREGCGQNRAVRGIDTT
jgi:hypothetical protein